MISRSISHRRGSLITLRTHYAQYLTRSQFDSPFDHLPTRRKPWISWKITAGFFTLGCFMAYNETLLDWYESYTTIDEGDEHNREVLPLQLEYKLKNLDIYQRLAHPKNSEKWYKLQSWENLDRNVLDSQEKKIKKVKGADLMKTNTTQDDSTKTKTSQDDSTQKARVTQQSEYKQPSLTTHTLARPGGILIKPVIFHNIDTDEGVTIVHVGYKLCGYPFMVHGGIIATLLNETFKRNASLSQATSSNLKDDFKVENLSILYKAPTFANQFLIVKTRTKESVENNKKTIRLESVIENKKGKVLVKGEALLHDTGRATKKIEEKKKKWFGGS